MCVAPEEKSPTQSRRTSPSTSPASSIYGGTSNPPSESADGPFKKRSKPAVILRKVKKSLASTITDNVTMREGSSTGRPVAMVKGFISSLTGSMSQSNATMPTVDTASVATTMESIVVSTTSDVPVSQSVLGEHHYIINDIIDYITQRSQLYYQLLPMNCVKRL